mmetsp:Transcript_5254/g.17456  ORF Transcript_5254/g.17456 Transcript_5254/m.17456 type:complete len:234 (-) Transcript_5254:221-922(-)
MGPPVRHPSHSHPVFPRLKVGAPQRGAQVDAALCAVCGDTHAAAACRGLRARADCHRGHGPISSSLAQGSLFRGLARTALLLLPVSRSHVHGGSRARTRRSPPVQPDAAPLLGQDSAHRLWRLLRGCDAARQVPGDGPVSSHAHAGQRDGGPRRGGYFPFDVRDRPFRPAPQQRLGDGYAGSLHPRPPSQVVAEPGAGGGRAARAGSDTPAHCGRRWQPTLHRTAPEHTPGRG